MDYQSRNVGDVRLAPDAPAWLVQLAAAVSQVERKEFFSHIEQYLEQVRATGRDAGLREARQLVAEFGLSEADVFGQAARAAAAKRDRRAVVKPKYRNPDTGVTWTGRGKPPAWIAGKDYAQFLIG